MAARQIALSAPAGGPGPFELSPGFRLEVIAAEPLVESPVAMAFDERGRLFVAEIPGYSERQSTPSGHGQIRLLQNPDSNGLYTVSSIYASNLNSPSALACYGGGVFVAAGPDLLYLRDRQTNGMADENQLIFYGFGQVTSSTIREGAVSSFQWGLDNRIHGVTSAGGVVVSPTVAMAAVSLENSDFSFDPRTRRLYPEAEASQSGLTYDWTGRRFTCDLDRPLMLTMYQRRYFSRNPYFPWPPELIDAASPATLVHPLTAIQASNPPSTYRAQASFAAASNWLTAARSCLIYLGALFPPAYRGSAFIADPEARLIHRVVLADEGLGARAQAPRGESKPEFLRSADPTFHPMQVIEGPDGALYVADRREGSDGRIYRIVPKEIPSVRPPELAGATTYQLVSALASPNAPLADMAARLLYERQDRRAVPLLGDMLARARSPEARVRALHALASLGALSEDRLISAFADQEAPVREHAVLLAENYITNGSISDTMWEQLSALASDPSLRVVYQLAFTAGEIQRPEAQALLTALLRGHKDNFWLSAAILSSLANHATDVFLNLARDPEFRGTSAGFNTLEQLAQMIGVQDHAGAATRLIDYFNDCDLGAVPLQNLLCALGEGLHRAGSSLGDADPNSLMQRFYEQAGFDILKGTLGNERTSLDMRLLSLVPEFHYVNNTAWPFAWLGTSQTQPIQSAAIASLRYCADPSVVTNLLAVWRVLSPALRRQTVATLLARSESVNVVLSALEQGTIPLANVSSTDANFLRTYPNSTVRDRALQIFGPAPLRHPVVVDQFKPALSLNGQTGHGQQIFSDRCASCHQISGDIPVLGPNLLGARTKGREFILESILEPQAKVRSGYETTVLQTKTGENLLGIVVHQNLLTVTLAQPSGVRSVWPRQSLQFDQPQTWSLMPEGLESGLSTQDMADLLEYIMTTGQ